MCICLFASHIIILHENHWLYKKKNVVGYDHMKKNDANEMESKEIKILSKLLIKNPYLHY